MKLSYETAIQKAIDNAPTIHSPDVADGDIVTSPPTESVLKYKPDDTTVDFNFADTVLDTTPNQIIVPDIDELICLQQQRAAIFGEVYDDIARAHTLHEDEHAQAARALGARSILYGMSFYRVVMTGKEHLPIIGSQEFIRPLEIKTTKLGLGALYAHPTVPSADDRRDLSDMGLSVDEVGHKATAYNATHADRLPVPRSYRPSTVRHII
jgi:hypothetical protein